MVPNSATFGLVVTDMTEARRNEEMLRALTHRVVQAQEAERGRVALELHDNITQLLCAILVPLPGAGRTNFPTRDGSAKRRGDRNSARCSARPPKKWSASRAICGPAYWTSWAWSPALRDDQRGVCGTDGRVAPAGLRGVGPHGCPPTAELALYRILQKALNNVEQHARARHVTVRLTKPDGFVQLAIKDDGIGFDPDRPAQWKGTERPRAAPDARASDLRGRRF